MTKKEIAKQLSKIDMSNLSKKDKKIISSIISGVQEDLIPLNYVSKLVKSLCDDNLKYKDKLNRYFYYGGYYFITNDFYLLSINRKYVDKKLFINFNKAVFDEHQIKCAKALLNKSVDYFPYNLDTKEYIKGCTDYIASSGTADKNNVCVRFVDYTQLLNMKLLNFFLGFLDGVEFDLYLSNKTTKPVLLFTDEFKLALMPLAPDFDFDTGRSGFYIDNRH